ncbi:MAG: ATP-dependent protease ATPase subunit HslU [Clostridia bacterium]|nr:ATP-dependent protease ATPase subunit HslU [Clostridia bacterium]
MATQFTPKEIVEQLDKYIIGQADAKKMVAVALRNRYRRSQLDPEIRDEVTPKNIIMKGPTGVGKTEIARRLAKLVKAPFVKVEATKFTEVGYVGRDVESMVRDLVENAISIVKQEKFDEVKPKATEQAVKKIAEVLLPIKKQARPDETDTQLKAELEQEIREGKLDNVKLKMTVTEKEKPMKLDTNDPSGINIGNIFSAMSGQKKTKVKEMRVKDAMDTFVNEISEGLVDMDNINIEGLKRAEQDGIIFIDEIDKIASNGNSHGPDVSREGVQRDILPIVEGCTVSTKYGMIKTDYILFIAAGAFHVAEVKDLIPELQGRFPVVVELDSLNKADFVRILTDTDNAITKLYAHLLKVDGVDLTFLADGIDRIAEVAEVQNEEMENIGARRLHALMEKLMEEVSFEACGNPIVVTVNKDYVDSHLGEAAINYDLKKYII